METYPRNYPQPLVTPYNWTVDMGVLRTPMDGGLSRQRRLYDVMPHAFEAEFVIPQAQLPAWQQWVNLYAYDFIQIDLLTYLTPVGNWASPHFARFTSGLTFTNLGRGFVSVRVTLELSPAQVSNYNPPPANNWIVAGIPDVPSSTNTVIAGSPPTPSPNLINAGTPPDQ